MQASRGHRSRAGGRSASALAAALLFLASPALADDFFVDAVNGSDANGGTAPGDAWRTLTHALAVVPDPVLPATHTIRVAPGVHDAALGEAFPLHLRPNLRVVGAGPAQTVLDGGGVEVSLVLVWPTVEQVAPDTLLAGLRLQRGAQGVGVSTTDWRVWATLEDLEIADMAWQGVGVYGSNLLSPASPAVTLRRVRMASPLPHGVSIEQTGKFTAATVRLEDSVIEGPSADGVHLSVSGIGCWGYLTLERCRVDSAGGAGVRVASASSQSFREVTIVDSAVVRCAGDGVRNEMETLATVEVRRSTVAHNGGVGLYHGSALHGSILAGNGDDLLGAPAVSYSDIEDGDFLGVNDCFAADPRFLDPAGGDFRLAFGSPCADAGDPAAPAGALDLAGIARPLDGDLDTAPRADVGAYELAPLSGGGEVRPGGAIELTLFGPDRGVALLTATRGPQIDPPVATVFGLLYLDPATLYSVALLPTSPTGERFARPLPADPSIVGTVWSVQAWMATGSTPSRALSNARTIVVVP